MRNYVQIAKRYARHAADVKHRKRYGKWVRLAAQRFLRDLEAVKKRRALFRFDAEEANRACSFIELLPHVEGTWDTETIVLHPSHVFATVNIFGFRAMDGTRRFSTALFAVARKNAKSTWAAAVMLFCLCCEAEAGAQVLSAATTGQQAKIVFNVAKKMVDKTPELREAFGLEAWASSIPSMHNGGVFKPINAKASTQDGLNPSAISLDELHAHKNFDLLNVLRSAAGARRNLLLLITTTEGYENPGPWGEQRKFAQRVLSGVIEADHYFAIIFAIDDEDKAAGIPADDMFDPSVWIKANPLIEVNPLLAAAIRKEAIEARSNPGQQGEFSIKRCNRQASSATSWVNLDKWRLGGGPIDVATLKGHKCWGAIDLAQTSDLASVRLVFLIEGVYYTIGRRFVPGEQVKHRTVRGMVPYAAWVDAGLIEETDGDVTDNAVIEEAIYDMNAEFQPEVWAYDRWNAMDVVRRLTDRGVPMVEFIQGLKSYHPAMKAFERAYLGGNLRHGGDPVLQWCASNLVAKKDENENLKPDRLRSADKIDDVATLIMAIGVSITPDDGVDLSALLSNGIIT